MSSLPKIKPTQLIAGPSSLSLPALSIKNEAQQRFESVMIKNHQQFENFSSQMIPIDNRKANYTTL